MRVIRSLIYAGLALAAMAFTIASPAVAAVPTDPGIYEAVKASIDAPAILQVHDGAVALTCEAPFAVMSAAGRSPLQTGTLNITDSTGARLLFIEVRRRC